MKKIKPLIIILLFLMAVFLPFIKADAESNLDNDSIMDTKAVEETTTPTMTLATPEGWFSGETVLSDIEFNKQPMDYDFLNVAPDDPTNVFTFVDLDRKHSIDNDGFTHILRVDFAVADPLLDYDINTRIYCGGAGIVYYEQYFRVYDGAVDSTTTASGTLTIDSDMLDSQGYLYLDFTCYANEATEALDFRMWLVDIGDGWTWTEVYHEEELGATAFGNVQWFQINSDYLYFLGDTIENNIRSKYQYVSDTVKIHSLTLPSVPHSKEINIYSPTHWTYSSINPAATVTTVDSDHTITSPTELTYEMFFTSNSTYLLALEETTENYLSDIGFENGEYSSDFSSTFETAIATNITFSGYHSLKLQSTSAKKLTLQSDDFAVNNYYLSFSLYLVSGSITITTDDYSDTISTTTNRWQLVQFHSLTTALSLNSSAVDCYFDNFRIFQVSTEIDTTDLDEYEISNSFVSWDGYQNPTATITNYNLTLIDRTAQTTVTSVNTSDLSYEYSASLEQKEYEVFIDAYSVGDTDFSNTSWFFTPSYPYEIDYVETVILDEWDFSEGDLDDWEGQAHYYDEVENGYLNFTSKANGQYKWFENPIEEPYITTSDSTNFVFRYKVDKTTSTEIAEMLIRFYYDATSVQYWIPIDSDGDYHIVEQEMLSGIEITRIIGYFGNVSDQTRWLMLGDSVLIDYIRLVQVEETTHFITDTTITFGSENNLLRNNVSSDNNLLGLYEEPFTVYLNGTIGSHSIIATPFDRVGETKAFLYSETNSYNYVVSENDNYLIALTTSADIVSGYFYTYVETYWGNQTYRVKDNSTWLGSGVSEGNAVWEFVESNYGLHVFTLEIYNGGSLWKTITTSVTTVEVVEGENYFEILTTSADVQSGLFYVTIETFWGNQTYRVMDNSTWLDTAINEGSSSWSFNITAYGLHVFTIYVYNGGSVWKTITTSVTIIEPEAVVNYFIVLTTSFDVAGGLFYTFIETFFANQTYRVKDNSTWLGSAVNEGSASWSFDEESYGLHVFTIEIYNGGSVWKTIVVSITIVEPAAEALVINLYEKSYDADSGYIYINYQTNWGNTTIRVMDNGTWIGSAVSGEELSIWTTTTSYGWHNITIIIYHDSVEWFTDEFSFTIIEPSAEVNYYLTIDMSVDVDGGLFYMTINTYWDNCTIQVFDNTTSLGSAVDEGSSVWEFNEESYGLHTFNISIFQNGVLWDSIITSVTIVEPDIEILSLNHYSVQFDADAGHIYLNYATNWANTTCRISDNSTWLSTVTIEGISIWTFTTNIGLHNITVIIYDNGVEWFTDVFSFTITLPEQFWQEVLFTFTSSYDSQTIDSNEYLQIFLNNALVSAGTSTYLSSFNISIYNNFNQLLYNYTNYPYAATIAIQLPLRNVTFYNPNTISCEYQIWQGTEYIQIWISPLTYSNYYMYDSNYTVLCNPSDIDAGNGYEYISTTASFEVEVGMSNIEVILGTQQVVIIYRIITIRTTSSYTGASVGERYLKYHLDGQLSLEGATTSTASLTIQLAVTDIFGNVLFNQSVAYARYIDITVPLRSCTFTNKELVSTTLTITQSGSDEHLFFVLGGSATVSVFLSDNTYVVILAPISPDKEEGVLWQPKDYDFTCSLASQSLDLWLDTFDNVPPLFDPFDANILDWLTNNRWLTIAALGFAAVNFIGLVFAVGVIIVRLPKAEEKRFETK